MMQEYRFQFSAMSSPCEISLVDSSSRQAADIAQEIVLHTRALERKYNFHDSNSWLNRVINQRHSHRTVLDVEAAEIFEKVWNLSAATLDRFDISIGTLIQAAKQHPGKPLNSLKNDLKAAMGTQCWRVNGCWLELDDMRTQLDLGGVIKEFAVDQAAGIAVNAEGGSMIQFGGDARVQGRKANGDCFQVGVSNPDIPGQMLMNLPLDDAAITTSGSQQLAGYTSEYKLASSAVSATVIAADALTAGIYSTSLMQDVDTALPDDMKCIVVDRYRKVYSNLAA